jgi:uncharacterized membrane protein (Fun14 family)
MRRLDDIPIDPDVAAALEAIDAGMAGEPVDPEHAELAELAALLAAERPRLSPSRARALDDRLQQASAARPRRRSWSIASSAMVACTAAVALVAILVVGGSPPHAPESALRTATSAAAGAGSSGAAPVAVPQPPGGGRQIVQAAQLQLSAAPDRIDEVAQEAFDVVGAAHGFVTSSTVTQTGGADGSANLQLSVPSASLVQTMNQLSRLRDATVTSSTNTVQDVTDQYGAAQRRLADAQALRTALLKQLAGARSPQQVNSLNAQLRDADGAIAAAQAALASLSRQVNFTQITLTIDAGAAAGGGFNLGQAAHDAGRILVVAAGAALIVMAALVPVGLLAGVAWWARAALRRRRREQALDAA